MRNARIASLTPFALAAAALVPAYAGDVPIPADTQIVTTASGLKYSVLTAGGAGERPQMGDSVRVHYTGWLTDGKLFDSSRERGEPAEFVLGRVIGGWNEALQLMTVGARWKLTIPAALGYGAAGSPPDIPGGATLVFDVELLGMTAMPRFRPARPEAQKTTASGLKYEVLKEGEGTPPGADDAFELNYALWTAAGKLLDCSASTKRPLKGRAADMKFGILKEGPALMKPGALYRFEAPPALAFGDKAMSADLPANSTTVWELELVKIIKPLTLPPFSPEGAPKAVKTASGLEIQTIREGTGRSPNRADFVTVHYAGWLTDGTLFDSSYMRGDPASFPVGGVIPGWTEGLQTMKEGGAARFTIPGDLAYGPQGRPPKIPANATLVFYVELIKVGR